MFFPNYKEERDMFFLADLKSRSIGGPGNAPLPKVSYDFCKCERLEFRKERRPGTLASYFQFTCKALSYN
jgi:hypothetical protein